ncbi:MAG: penicillin-binding protein [Muribaculaceae bacterium]|nr:penicillin-binding protein [Muribaculaceae bacterium]
MANRNIWYKIGDFYHAIKDRYKRFNAWYKRLYKGKPWYARAFYAMCTLFVTIFLFLVAVNINFLWLFGKSPSLFEIMEPRPYNASYVYSSDGKQIGKLFKENRTPVKYEEIDTMFFKLLIDTEDERFYNHWGIDFHGMAGAAKDFVVHRRARGASTITQQLVKNMFKMRTRAYSNGLLCHIPGVRMIITKVKEWILASEIEAFYDKKRILEMYANTVDFGNQAFGIKTAAKTYFNTTPDKLKIEQSAMLVGILKGTSIYNPRNNPNRCLERRNVVLNNALIHNDITQSQYNRLSKLKLRLKYTPETENNNECPYFLNALAEEMRDWCEDNDIDFYRDGLKIYTTIDTRMQKYAEQAVWQQMKVVQQNFDREWGDRPCWVDEKGNEIPGFVNDKAERSDVYKQLMVKFDENIDSVEYYMNKPHSGVKLFDYNSKNHYRDATMSSVDSIKHMLHKMHCGFIAMDPHTGEVKAWVGDVDYKAWQYDNVRAQHQPGSTFKLFVYSAALIEGRRPCDQYMDSPLTTPLMDTDKKSGRSKLWEPKNANGRFTNSSMTMRAALARSNNIIAVKVGNDVGVKRVAQAARDMGIKSNLDETPSLCLGSSDVNLLEMASAYSTVVNDGQPKKPVLVTRIVRTNKKGEAEEIYNSHGQEDPNRAMSHNQAYSMRKMLEAVCNDAGGTGAALRNYVSGMEVGGKTGTSDNYTDAWFMAITPDLVCGTWVGGAYRQIHFRSAQGQGSRAALPVVGLFLQKVLADGNFSRLRRTFPADHELDKYIMACSNSISSPNNSDSVPSDAYQPYSDTLPNQNSADGGPKTMKDIVDEDINGSNKQEQPAPKDPPTQKDERAPSQGPDRAKNAFKNGQTL